MQSSTAVAPQPPCKPRHDVLKVVVCRMLPIPGHLHTCVQVHFYLGSSYVALKEVQLPAQPSSADADGEASTAQRCLS